MKKQLALGFWVAAGVAAGGVGLAAKSDRQPDLKVQEPKVLPAEYAEWPVANQKAVLMEEWVMKLCSPVSLEHGSDNPHDKAWIKVYVSKEGVPAMQKLDQAFPVGTVVVKEKREKDKRNAPPIFFTVMTKREKGYNPKSGDWEYSIYDGQRKQTETGKIERCMTCHERVKGQDYIFGNYRDEAFMKIK
jgi:hypothetical protein